MDIDVAATTLIGLGFASSCLTGTHLGRFRRGDPIVVTIESPDVPDKAPFLIVFDADMNVISSLDMAMFGPTRTRFRATYVPGTEADLGEHRLYCGFYVSGVASLIDRRFELVAGGDSGGHVMALHATDRPEGRTVIAQLASGRLAVGRNPYI
jgi:hypothetical protein